MGLAVELFAKKRLSLDYSVSRECKPYHRDVVFLPESLRGFRDGLRRLRTDGACAVETKQPSAGVSRFNHSIRKKGETIAPRELKSALLI